MEFAVYVSWDHGDLVSAKAVEEFNGAFLPADQSICVWVEPESPTLLKVSFDVQASSGGSALDVARSIVTSAAKVADVTGVAVDVVAMTEDSTWRA